MNGEICERLHLDPETVQSHAIAYRGLARALARNEEPSGEFSPYWRAVVADGSRAARCSGYFAVAASYLSASEPSAASECFDQAARWAWRQAGALAESVATGDKEDQRGAVSDAALSWRLRAALLDACTGKPSFPVRELDPLFERISPAMPWLGHELVVTLLRHTMADGESDKRAVEQIYKLLDVFSEVRPAPVGVFRLPLGFALQLAQLAVRRIPGERSGELLDWGRSFGDRLRERVALAQTAKRHWRQLYSRLLPIEPEGLLPTAVWLRLVNPLENARPQVRAILDQNSVLSAYAEAARVMYDLGFGRDRDRGSDLDRGPDLGPALA